MAATITYKKYRKFYKYKLIKLYEISLPWLSDVKNGEVPGGWAKIDGSVLSIMENYCWDGPSGPTFDTKTFMRGSLVHDALYQLMREGVLISKYHRKKSDETMAKINKEDGMNKFRVWYTYAAVRMFGWLYSNKQKSKILTAP